MLLAASEKGDEDHATCEVLFVDDAEVGTVIKSEDEGEVTKVTTYVKPQHFFEFEIVTDAEGFVTLDGKKLFAGEVALKANKYFNGQVG